MTMNFHTDLQDADFEDSGNFTSQNSSDSYAHEEISSPESLQEYSIPSPQQHVCYGCHGIIEDQYILQLADQTWHPTCLRCSHCHAILDNATTCIVKNGKIFCRKEELGIPCTKCNKVIHSQAWTRNINDNWYHLQCFCCDICSRQLSTGEQFALHNQQLLCKIHYLQVTRGLNNRNTRDRSGKRRAKRLRTAFNEEQIMIFQAFFEHEHNPDAEELDALAEQAGVGRRVAQVWFQNARARSKRSPMTSCSSPDSVSSKTSSSPENSLSCFDDLDALEDLQDLITFAQ